MTATAAVISTRRQPIADLELYATEPSTLEARAASQNSARAVRGWTDRIMQSPHFKASTYRTAHFLGKLFIADALGERNGHIHPSQPHLMEAVGCERNTIKSAVKELKDAGFLEVKPGLGKGRASEYVLRFPVEI